MKKFIALISASFIFCNLHAQQLSIGARMGGSQWLNMQNDLTKSTNNSSATWDKELFVRYKTKGKITLEATIGHYAFDQTTNPDYSNELPNPNGYQIVKINEHSQNIEWNLSAQYNITCPSMQACPVMKHIQSYIGFVLSPTLSHSTTSITTRKLNDGSLTTFSESGNNLTMWAGLSHTLTYSINKNFYLTSVARLQFDPNELFNNSGQTPSPNTRFGLQFGVGYNLK